MAPKLSVNCKSSNSNEAPWCAADAVLTTRAGAGHKALAQSLRHDKISHMIERERKFEPILGELAGGEHGAGIVDQDVDTGFRFCDFGCDPLPEMRVRSA
jgi:hypothetical protein